jgi:purine-nucleoside phosphorylase
VSAAAGGVDVEAAARALDRRFPGTPTVSIVLGSGLSGLVEGVEDPVEVPFQEVPGLPASGVAGHAGRFVHGRLEGRPVLLQAGRFHAYEGHPMEVVCAPVRIAAALGVGAMVFTNAAGGISRGLEPGTLLLLDDHLDLQLRGPLAGPVVPGEERFPDMSAPYDPGLQRRAVAAAAELGIHLPRGVYAAVLGPSYETPAEVAMLRTLGADVVGMSTVPEVIAARARGIPVLAISLVTNRAAGLSLSPLSHDEVLETGRVAGRRLERLLRRLVGELPQEPPG